MTDDEFEALLRPAQTTSPSTPPPGERRRRHARRSDDRVAHRRAGIAVLSFFLVLILSLGGAGWWAWSQYGESVREFFLGETVEDFDEGDIAGDGAEVLITVNPGDIGEVVARTLFEQGVTASFEAVYNILLQDTTIVFQPGTYRLTEEMSAEAAIQALLDPANRAEYRFTVVEGVRLVDALQVIADNTSIPLAELEDAVSDPTVYGIDLPIETMEGYLAPATYAFDWGTDATTVIQEMVDVTLERLEERGVSAEAWHEVLTIASIIEREARLEDDFYKVSRVIANRLAPDSPVTLLQMDSTITYWEETFDTVWTTDAERENADNPYNTYRFPGLPPGPIALPGELAIDAAVNPADGPWLYFVTWNMATGETLFATTLSEHERYIALGKECRDNEDLRDQCRNLQ